MLFQDITQFELDKALDRAHILEGYKIVIDNVDEVIKIIRASKSIPDAKQTFVRTFLTYRRTVRRNRKNAARSFVRYGT